MFHVFASQEDRRAFGGSAFIEIQYCRHPKYTPVRQLVSVDFIRNWEDDSLYVSDDCMNEFFDQYAAILGWKTGMRLFEISYYSCEQSAKIMADAARLKPIGHEKLIEWLKQAQEH